MNASRWPQQRLRLKLARAQAEQCHPEARSFAAGEPRGGGCFGAPGIFISTGSARSTYSVRLRGFR